MQQEIKEKEIDPMSFSFSIAAAGDGDYPAAASDLDFSFNSTASTSTFASTSSSSSARSSLSLPSSSSTSTITPLPHSRSNSSPHWSALRAAASLSGDGTLHLRHLHLLRHLGSGHLARVFHCRLKGSHSSDFALKVIDLDAAAPAKLLPHVHTESLVLSHLDHPFLPTLYARIDASHYACFLIDYCPGGDLHSLLLRHPTHRLPISAVRFFASEVLLALEYLHALGFVYRDLKPENVLIRSDGHIMLSDFDLCFSSANATSPSIHRRHAPRKHRSSCWSNSISNRTEEELEIIAEPEEAFSRACVGTHEYLAPEIVSGAGHGKGVDWWAFGIFVYELMYGRTPFKGRSKEATLKNILSNEVKFREHGNGGDEDEVVVRDLICRLLVRDVEGRMGCRRGAAEIKKHPFFRGVRWQFIRCERPPVVVADGVGWVKERRKRAAVWSRIKRGVKFFGGGNIFSVGSSNSNKSKRRLTRQKAVKL